MANIDANFNPSIFRKSWPIIIAQNRNLAIINPVRLAYDSDGYNAGQVLARRNDGEFAKYDDGGSSGLNTARCVLLEDHPVADFDAQVASGTSMAKAAFSGVLFKDLLLGLDAAAIVDLDAKTLVDARNVNLLKF